MKRLYYIIATFWFASSAGAQWEVIDEGDLAFVISAQSNAITEVTQGFDLLPIEHVAIMHRIGGDEGPLYALEAISKGVCLTPIDSFISNNGGLEYILIGKIQELDSNKSIHNALQYVGRQYDYNYMPDNDEIYCSELVQKCYISIDGNPVFNTIPMTFRNPAGIIHPHWIQHYAKQGLTVPEGVPGSNPGNLSRNAKVKIVSIKK